MQSTDPFLAEMTRRLHDTLHDEAFQKRLAEVTNSRPWKKIVEFLCVRREQLYLTVPPTSFAMAQRDGAMAEIQRLILHGPKLLLTAQVATEQQSNWVDPSTPAGDLVPSLPPDDDGLG